MIERALRPTLAIALCATVFASTVAVAAALDISAGTLATFSRAYGGPVTCSLQPVADAHVRQDDAQTTYGSAVLLEIDSDPSAARRVFLRFDLAGCSPAIPADAIVHSATIRMTLAASAAEARSYDLHRVTASWSEGTVNWDNQPAPAGSASGSASVAAGTAASTVLEWNVAADVQDLVSGAAANDGWRVSDNAEGSAPSSLLQLHSREDSAGRPELVITYAD